MLKTNRKKMIVCCFSAMLLLLFFVFTFPVAPRAGEKTPPFYPEEGPGSKPDSGVPVKDFQSLFKEPGKTGPVKKTPPYGKSEAGAPDRKTGPEALAEQVPGIDDKGFRTQEYVVKEGDWLVKILREKGLVEDENLPELLSLLRKLNSSLKSLDMIKPGEKIVILVKVIPESREEKAATVTRTRTPTRKLKYEPYRIRRGDTLTGLVMGRYDISPKEFSDAYLRLFSECNPSIQNPDRLLVGQTVRLPHYPAAYVEADEALPVMRDLEKSAHRVALKPPSAPESPPPPPPPPPPPGKPPTPPAPAVKDTLPPPKPSLPPVTAMPSTREHGALVPGMVRGTSVVILEGLGAVIAGMGEEWVDSGEHFIPMRSGGHINLKAESFPIIRLQEGITVIVDTRSALPQTMAKVIESTWATYRVVQLSAGDDLRSALDKILTAFNYQRIVKKGAPLTLGGNIPVSITGDWILSPPRTDPDRGPRFVVINLMPGRGQGLPGAIKNYLKLLGVEVIEYPETDEGPSAAGASATARTATDAEALIKAVLELRGLPFTTRKDIPAYATQNRDFKFTVQADFYLEIGQRRYIIDGGGMGPDVVSLLKENGISVLSLAQGMKPVDMVSTILQFLNVHFEPGPHAFMARGGDVSRNVKLTLSGIKFYDNKGASVLATSLNLPTDLVAFLSQRGYRVLLLPPSASRNA